jgi:hypothetical protein
MPKAPSPDTLKKQAKSGQAPERQPLAEPHAHVDDNLTLKTEAARALGLWDKVRRYGWGALTAKESGAVGGYMTRVRFQARRQESDSPNNSP